MNLSGVLPGLLGLLLLAWPVTTNAAIPENDHFAARFPLFGTNITTTGNNVGATKDPDEPDPSFMAEKSVWWSWTAPVNAALTLSTAGSSFDTMLSVFTGDALTNLALVGFNDNETNTSTVKFNVVAGTAYQIAVDGAVGAAGAITLKLTTGATQPPPVNDNFANRTTISGTHLSNVNGSNVGATMEPGEPFHADNVGLKSAWWSWTAPDSGGVTLSTQTSSFDTVLGVYTGDSVSNLVFVAGNDEDPTSSFGLISRVTFNALSNTTYQIAVDGFEGDEGDIRLRLDLGTAFPAPPNDNFSNRIAFTGSSITVTGSNVGASFEALDADFEAGEPMHLFTFGGKSVWWSWTAASSGQVTLSTSNSTFDTILCVYTGDSLTNLAFVAGNDEDYLNPAGGTSRLTFNATNGTTYQIAVDGYDGDSGTINLRLVQGALVAAPPNNNFANRTLLTGSSISTSGSTLGATLEPGEPLHNNAYGGKSAWWRWVSPAAGIVNMDTIGSDFDTILAVYTGSSLSNLVEVASDDESGGNYTSKVTFYTKSGVTNQIAVDGYDGDSGSVTLHIAFTAASYGLTITTNPAAVGIVSIEPAPDQNGKYAPNELVTLAAAPTAPGYLFTTWSGSNSSTNNPFSLGMTGTKTIAANFFLPPPSLLTWEPQSPESLRTNGFQFLLTGPTNYFYALERSTNLTNWSPFLTDELTSVQSLTIRDYDATNYEHRFYRARRLP